MLHQDFRCDNLFFASGDTGEDVVVIDWQGLGRGPGSYDLAYLLGGSLTIGDRREHEERIVRDLPRAPARRRGRAATASTTCGPTTGSRTSSTPRCAVITGGTMDLANERGRQLVGTLAQRHFTAVLDLRSVDLIA